VTEGVAVGMTELAEFRRDDDAPEHERLSWYEPMDIPALADAGAHGRS
jgi:hypothetical protein